MKKKRYKYAGSYLSPWMILVTTIILLAIVVTMAFSNYNREKHYMADILLEKGAALITTFEAGARTGMMSMGWGGNQIQQMLEAIARQPDILYLVITDANGNILAHNDAGKVGNPFSAISGEEIPIPEQSSKWRLTSTKTGIPAFEVYQLFKPLTDKECRMAQGRGWCSMANCQNTWCAPRNYQLKNQQIIFIGFDRTHFIEAREEDLRNTAIISSVLLLLGFAGFLTMFLTRSYRATRRRLQDTSAIAEEVVANLPVGLMVMDFENNVVLENNSAVNITGISAQQVRGKPADQILPENLLQLSAKAQEEKRIIEQEIECRFGDHKPVALSVSAASITNEAGVFIGSLMILRDLTEIKALQQAVQRKEKLAAIGGLAAGIAHEIRNPLSSIKGMATFFKNRFGNDPEAHEAATVMVSETDRLNRVISELLEFARPSTIDTKPSNMNTILEHSIRLIKSDADDHHVRLQLITNNDLPPADIDSDRFVQCLLNLYLNGIQAMESGGEIAIQSRQAEDSGIEIRISDTGAGISQENLNRIFNPYFTTKSTGTGLGLAIVHKVIENHGGRIFVESNPGKGTVFTIWLPESRTKDLDEVKQ